MRCCEFKSALNIGLSSNFFGGIHGITKAKLLKRKRGYIYDRSVQRDINCFPDYFPIIVPLIKGLFTYSCETKIFTITKSYINPTEIVQTSIYQDKSFCSHYKIFEIPKSKIHFIKFWRLQILLLIFFDKNIKFEFQYRTKNMEMLTDNMKYSKFV